MVHSKYTGRPPPQLIHHNQTVHTAGSPGTYSFELQSDEKFKLSQENIQSVNKIGNSEIYRLNHTPEKLFEKGGESFHRNIRKFWILRVESLWGIEQSSSV